MSKQKMGVLVMSYGTPTSMEDIESYYTHIRHGRPPSREQLEELKARYEAIVGGVFPLREHTNQQVQELEKYLNRLDTPYDFVCYQGLKHASPFIEDGVTQMAEDGIAQGVGIVLAPHYSIMSIGSYIERAQKKAAEVHVQLSFVESYHLNPIFIEVVSERVKEALQKFSTDDVLVLFSAHSLPEKILEMGDPYVEQLLASSKAVAEKAGIEKWQFAWQSAGQTSVPWLGPDITEVLRNLHQEGVHHVLICPIGFVSDHLEVLYDIDIECQEIARELGMHLERTRSLNADPKYIATLADEILKKLQ